MVTTSVLCDQPFAASCHYTSHRRVFECLRTPNAIIYNRNSNANISGYCARWLIKSTNHNKRLRGVSSFNRNVLTCSIWMNWQRRSMTRTNIFTIIAEILLSDWKELRVSRNITQVSQSLRDSQSPVCFYYSVSFFKVLWVHKSGTRQKRKTRNSKLQSRIVSSFIHDCFLAISVSGKEKK